MSKVARVLLILLLVSLGGVGVGECFGDTASEGGKGKDASSKVLKLSDGSEIRFVSARKFGDNALRVVLPGGKVVLVSRSRLSEAERKRWFHSPTLNVRRRASEPRRFPLKYGVAKVVSSKLPKDYDPYKFRDSIKVRYEALKLGEYDALKTAWKRLVDDPKVTSLDQLFVPEERGTMKYYYFVPDKQNLKGAGKVPLVVFLHGMGDNQHMNRHPQCLIFVQPSVQKQYPCFFLAPLSNGDGGDWMSYGPDKISDEAMFVVGIIDDMLRQYPQIDADRIYLTGLSSGGYGVWDMLAKFPGKFAGGVPLAAGLEELLENVKYRQKIAIWACVNVREQEDAKKGAKALLKRFAKLGADGRYTEYDVTTKYDKFHKHNNRTPKLSVRHAAQAWAYAEPKLIPWLFEHTRDKKAAAAAAKRKKSGSP